MPGHVGKLEKEAIGEPSGVLAKPDYGTGCG